MSAGIVKKAWVFLGLSAFVAFPGCGVKTDPQPYVDVQKAAAPVPEPIPAPSPIPTPAPKPQAPVQKSKKKGLKK